MSDWDIVEQFVNKSGFIPEYSTFEDYVVSILLHYDALAEDDETLTLCDFIDRFAEYGRFIGG